LSVMRIENKNNRTSRKEDLDIRMEYTITGKTCVTKYGSKIVITIDVEGEMADRFTPNRFLSKRADLEKEFKN